MLQKIKRFFINKESKGFSLIEAIVSTAVVGIGFVGVYTIVATSEQLMMRSIAKEKTQMIADQILDIIETDLANIDSYEMDLETCVDPGSSTDQYDIRGYEWCMRITNEVGAPTDNDDRSITVTTLGDGRRVVHILLESYDERVQIVMKRVFDD